MTKTGLKNIFSIPIYTTFIEKSIADKVENLIVPRLDKLPSIQDAQYSDFFEDKKLVSPTEIADLLKQIDIFIDKFVHSTNLVKGDKARYWIQNYKQNNHHPRHNHIGKNIISGVYYVRANKYAGKLRFENPNLFSLGTFFSKPVPDFVNYDVIPKKGLLVIFPGWLPHEVIPSFHPDCIRTCLAFNISEN